jgi:hypothetical protein
LSANNTISAEEMQCEDVHRATQAAGPTLSIGHADLAAKQPTNTNNDCSTTEDCKGMAAVGRDDHVSLHYRSGRTETASYEKEKWKKNSSPSEGTRTKMLI